MLDDKNNEIIVYIKDITLNKINLFKNEIINKDCLNFQNTTSKVKDETNYSGQKISSPSVNFSAAFRVKRITDEGTKYGFITCAHGNTLLSNIYGADGSLIGTVKLRQYSGNLDASYVEMNSSTDFINTISYSSYTLSNTNDDLYYPTCGQSICLYGWKTHGSTGTINSTNYSYTIGTTQFSGLYSANYSSQTEDSGGLIYSGAINNICNLLGVHKGVDSNNNALFTGAIKIINKWYLLRY